MDALFNRRLLEQTTWDSGSLTGLGTVVHKFEEPGEYAVKILQSDEIIEELPLTVTEEAPGEEPQPPGAEPRLRSVDLDLRELRSDLDLRELRRAGPRRPAGEFRRDMVVGTAGYASFYDSSGKGDVTVVVEKRDGGGPEPFDGRRLGDGDLFAVTLLRPGTYSITNIHSGAQGEATVAYPTVGDEPYRPPDPVAVECTDARFEPSKIDLQPAQGLVFHIATPSRIKIDLVEPDEGPQEARGRRRIGWRRQPTQ